MTAPSEREKAFIVDSLRRLRDHFKVWPEYEGFEHALIGFAIYEGAYKDAASGRIIAETAPFALGQELVSHYGFEWVILKEPIDVARYAVRHPKVADPIRVLTLEDGSWFEEDPTDGEPPIPGERTYQSLDQILKAAGLRRLHNSS
jgi:hypothetical protein